MSETIVEVKVIEKKDNCEATLNQKDSIGEFDIFTQLLNDFTEFEIEIVEVFKGDINKSITTLRASDINSSCFWEPEVGKSYVLYTGKTINSADGNILEIEGCQRRIRNDQTNYTSEIQALKILKDKKEGFFIVDQSELLNQKKGYYITLKGSHKNGQRHGKWVLAEPINYSNSSAKVKSRIFVLKYKHGKLFFAKHFEPNNSFAKNYYMARWKFFFNK
ncbi:hypothetical protein [Fulvitalea axinellae]